MSTEGEPRIRIAPRTAAGLAIRRGERLRIVDVEGEQVADLVSCVPGRDPEWLSNGRTFDDLETLAISTGHVLSSDRCRPMWTVEEDRVGRHDFLISACSREMLCKAYGMEGAPPNCTDNLTRALVDHGVTAAHLPTPFNVFMNMRVREGGSLELRPPLSRPGDFVVLRAELDMVVAVSACSAPTCNAGTFGPIDLELLPCA